MNGSTRFIALLLTAIAMTALHAGLAAAAEGGIRIKELARLASTHDNSLVGYGIVTGLAGTGDSRRSVATNQSIENVLRNFGLNVLNERLRARNVAGVIVTATLPAFSRTGDKIDVVVSSVGDARSLLGGSLLLTELRGADGEVYALAQGPMSVGGFKYDLNGNVVQKNHPTTGTIPSGATVEVNVETKLTNADGSFEYVLFEPDFTTATRVVDALNEVLEQPGAIVVDAGRVRVDAPWLAGRELISFLARAEGMTVEPDGRARVIVNERTGTVVTGGDVRISATTITHGNLKVSISTEYFASQPLLVRDTGPGVRTVVLPDTTIEVEEEASASVTMPRGSSVADLVVALNRVGATSRDVIVILQGIKRAGALHADLQIQ